MFSLVVPTFNERANIGSLIGRIEAVLKQQPFEFEIILVDDNSPDETWRLAQEIAKEDSRLHVIRREGARGLVKGRADIVIGSTHNSGGGVGEWNLPRRFVSRGAAIIAFLALPQILRVVQDSMSGFF